jgi:hypothetical protein
LRPTTNPGVALLFGLAATLSSGACMRIYADPDLPDVRGEWDASLCEEGTTITLSASAGPTSLDARADAELDGMVQVSAPCADGRAVLEDVARSELEVQGVARSAAGEMLTVASYRVDTRDGNNKKAFLNFPDPTFGRLRATWTFADGGTCDSNAVALVWLRLTALDKLSSYFTMCDDDLPIEVLEGTYQLEVFGQTIEGQVIRRAAPIEGVVIAPRGALTELGEVRLEPCSGMCDS